GYVDDLSGADARNGESTERARGGGGSRILPPAPVKGSWSDTLSLHLVWPCFRVRTGFSTRVDARSAPSRSAPTGRIQRNPVGLLQRTKHRHAVEASPTSVQSGNRADS